MQQHTCICPLSNILFSLSQLYTVAPLNHIGITTSKLLWDLEPEHPALEDKPMKYYEKEKVKAFKL